ncbi:four helix bundle protein [Clostridium frigidicarnis]|uniref:Four helix bundle protein n=1 Tax=Clostridium frigidicarnis TaxID=84698 RepID=A0A1I1AP03_9CLOT|nr:four helix bundle protein [Clostridium frigidicarnis]SFB39754.1 four helix bundle protein [Clostridium frigidicarnis]
MTESLVYNKAFKFAVKIVNLYKDLCKEKNEYTISRQVLKSGTSIGANIKEAVQASSKRDFLMKMNIALKEASETDYWLELLKATDYVDSNTLESIMHECTELNNMLSAIVKTTKKKLNIT